jgi:predicted PurR-regulated permease PerM
MPSLEPRGRIFPRWMVATAAMFVVGFLLYVLRGALTPVFFAFLIAYMLDPVVDRFEARGHSRAIGIAVMLTVVLGGMALFLALALPGAIRDLVEFFRDLPSKASELVAIAEPTLTRLGIPVPRSLDEALAQMHVDMRELAKQVAVPAGTVIKTLLGGTLSLLGVLAGLILVPVFAAYLLYDFDRIVIGARELVPPRYRGFVVEIARDVDTILGEFIRGQLIVMLILAVLYSTAYALLGVRLGVIIGLTAGLLSFIPYVGGGVALVFGVIMSLVYWTGWGQLAGVLVAYGIIQALEGLVITPRVVGDKVGLSAVWVLFALLVGGELFGFMGVLLALPAAAVVKIFVVRGLGWYRASALFLGSTVPGGPSFVDPPAPTTPDPPPRAASPPAAKGTAVIVEHSTLFVERSTVELDRPALLGDSSDALGESSDVLTGPDDRDPTARR